MSEDEENLVDQEKIIDILKTNKVRISNKGNICLNDFVKNIVKSKNPDQYIKRLKCDKIDIRGNDYITPDDCIDIIKKTNKGKCKEILEEISSNDTRHNETWIIMSGNLEKKRQRINIHRNINELEKKMKQIEKKIYQRVANCDKMFDMLLKMNFAVYISYIKPTDVFSLRELIDVEYLNKNVPQIKLMNTRPIIKTIKMYKNKMYELELLKLEYKKLSKTCQKENNKLVLKNKDLIKICGNFVPSTGEKKAMSFLDQITEKYDFYYFYKYRFPYCKHKATLEYDFFCILIHNKQLFLFVIEYDGGFHFLEKTDFIDPIAYHRRDILKQYYLSQMNIHLLRLNDNLNIGSSIIDFMNKIIDSDTYIIDKQIKLRKELFDDDNVHNGLIYFNDCMEAIRYNHEEEIKQYEIDTDDLNGMEYDKDYFSLEDFDYETQNNVIAL